MKTAWTRLCALACALACAAPAAAECAGTRVELAACVPRESSVLLGCGSASVQDAAAACDPETWTCVWTWTVVVTASAGTCARLALSKSGGGEPGTRHEVTACCPYVNVGSEGGVNACHNVLVVKYPMSRDHVYGGYLGERSFRAELLVWLNLVLVRDPASDSRTFDARPCPPPEEPATRSALPGGVLGGVYWALVQALPEGTLHPNPP